MPRVVQSAMPQTRVTIWLQRTPCARTTYREALRMALREALQRDERVFLMGEDVARYGGSYAVSKGLFEEFGEERIRDTPLSESAFVGAGIGAAMNGMRPIVEVMTVNFSLLALDQIVNNAATLAAHVWRSVLRPVGDPDGHRGRAPAGRATLAQPGRLVRAHSRLAHCRARDAGRRARHAVDGTRRPRPGHHLRARACCTTWKASCRRMPARWTSTAQRCGALETTSLSSPTVAALGKAMQAAEQLAQDGIERRSDRPAHTAPARHRRHPGLGAERRIVRWSSTKAGRASGYPPRSARASWKARFYDLDAPVARVCSAGRCPIPYAKHMEEAALPQTADIVAAAQRDFATVPDFRMPVLGADMEAGELVEWLVKPGPQVKRGDVVAAVETEKGAVDVEIWEDGIVDALMVEPGTKVPAGNCSRYCARPAPTGCGSELRWQRLLRLQHRHRCCRGAGRQDPERARPAAASAERYKVSPAARRQSPAARRRSLDARPERTGGGHPDRRRRARGQSKPAVRHRPRTASHAPGDRRGDGQIQARDPALLSRHDRRCHAALDWLARENAAAQRERPHPVRCGAAASGGAGAQGSAGAERFLDRRPFKPSRGRIWVSASRCAAAGWSRPRFTTHRRRRIPEMMTAMADLVQRARAGACAAPS